jgi:hypothetical protein
MLSPVQLLTCAKISFQSYCSSTSHRLAARNTCLVSHEHAASFGTGFSVIGENFFKRAKFWALKRGVGCHEMDQMANDDTTRNFEFC